MNPRLPKGCTLKRPSHIRQRNGETYRAAAYRFRKRFADYQDAYRMLRCESYKRMGTRRQLMMFRAFGCLEGKWLVKS